MVEVLIQLEGDTFVPRQRAIEWETRFAVRLDDRQCEDTRFSLDVLVDPTSNASYNCIALVWL